MSVCLVLTNEVSNDNWKTSVPLNDGWGTEGMGSMIQYQLLLYFFSDFTGIPFTYTGSKNFAHHSYTGYSEDEFHKSIDTFFNFPKLENIWDKVYDYTGDKDRHQKNIHSGDSFDKEFFDLVEKYERSDDKILLNLNGCHMKVLTYCKENLEKIFTKDRIDRIRNNLIFNGKKYFDDDDVHISWHLRTANPNDIPAEIVSPLRDYYTPENNFSRYRNLIDLLKSNSEGKNVILHIHSQGFTHDFQSLLDLKEDNFNIVTHIDDNPLSDIYHMANASLLIMANSSFSWIASFLNSNQIIVRDNWCLFVHPNSIRVNYDYRLL